MRFEGDHNTISVSQASQRLYIDLLGRLGILNRNYDERYKCRAFDPDVPITKYLYILCSALRALVVILLEIDNKHLIIVRFSRLEAREPRMRGSPTRVHVVPSDPLFSLIDTILTCQAAFRQNVVPKVFILRTRINLQYIDFWCNSML
jgi:hypothetical protein